ncbi:MAG TPA: GlxA family transcriptional regulator [Geminicoccus sp.]|uniref:GlxA family transcriptional regulator n=1 Tax=Geminicoccus sp. TaxID=2024832 RepID=UPI002CC90022|nr:GlxA family transcriptional regulator [Geminicoccus sp.]HWL67809.1 GlxA family transcriptional regulator [Geminicoccus sp.]
MARKDVALLVHDGVQALDVVGPLDVFAEANGFLPSRDGYDCHLLAADEAPVRASNGMLLAADLTFAQADRRFHTVLVAGGPGLPEAPADEGMSQWLCRWGVLAERYGSICTGAFVLGHAGLLDGRTVTTHWQNAAQLADRFPCARVEHDRIYARDGALVTSAGVTAGIDLALALVGEDHGQAVSLACAKRLVVVAQRQGGQSQFSPLLQPRTSPDTPIGRVQAYVMDHPDEPFPVERLAEIAGTSRRSIARLFVRELGITPHDFVEGVRLDHARNLLEATDLALKAVAFDCGFASPEQMRAAFQRRLGLSPLRYRESFRTVLRRAGQAGSSA